MSGDGFVSIIISHYNRPYLCRHAIYSAIYQTVRPKEIIVVDDRSSDTNRIIVERFCRARGVKWIAREVNGGPSAARNEGIKVAKGEWIQIVDSDDFLPPTSLADRLNLVANNPNTLWIAGNATKVPWFVTPKWLKSRLLTLFLPYLQKPVPVVKPEQVPIEDPFKVRWYHVAILYHRSLFEKYGLYDDTIFMGEDKELRWRFWNFSKTTPIATEKIVYFCRYGNPGKLTRRVGLFDQTQEKGRLARQKLLEQINNKINQGLNNNNTPFL